MIAIETRHETHIRSAENMKELPENSVDLVVTSPPYPMIGMWDTIFAKLDPAIAQALEEGTARKAFFLMHEKLDAVWEELPRLVKEGGIVCVNIGDATRSMNGRFELHPNAARITEKMLALGLSALPSVIWKKPTNAPNKFLGSGMLPVNAYVTLEHEQILIFRKGAPRFFETSEERRRRAESALFYEERNRLFSSFWEVGGKKQLLSGKNRERSAAFPLEIPLRLIRMFSVREDTVLDPFLGTGTTQFAAAMLGRNSIGFEIDASLVTDLSDTLASLPATSRDSIEGRIARHEDFVKSSKTPLHYRTEAGGIPVKTRQEEGIRFFMVQKTRRLEEGVHIVHHTEYPL